MMPVQLLQGWAVVVVLMLSTAAGGYWAGDHQRNNAWLARQAVQERAANAALKAEVERSQVAQQKYIDAAQALQISYQNLEVKFHELTERGPLVVYRAAAAGHVVGGTGGAGAAPAAAAGHAVKAAGAGLELAGETRHGAADAGAGLGLSLGAVWMWNSALFAADTAAGACSAADTASAACAVDSGLGLADAWANHAANARACATDRLRHQQLIDYLANQPKPAP